MMFSILFGILASVLPNLLFRWLYHLSKAKAPNTFIKFFYLNEGLKFAGLALLVSACLLWPSLQINKFFGAFICAEAARFLYTVFLLKRTTIT